MEVGCVVAPCKRECTKHSVGFPGICILPLRIKTLPECQTLLGLTNFTHSWEEEAERDDRAVYNFILVKILKNPTKSLFVIKCMLELISQTPLLPHQQIKLKGVQVPAESPISKGKDGWKFPCSSIFA